MTPSPSSKNLYWEQMVGVSSRRTGVTFFIVCELSPAQRANRDRDHPNSGPFEIAPLRIINAVFAVARGASIECRRR
jgi:hypothetical protein